MPTPHPATLAKLRHLYHTTWSRPWPEPDAYLVTLWLEARAAHNATRAQVPPPAVWDYCLESMRECHEFTPHQPPDTNQVPIPETPDTNQVPIP